MRACHFNGRLASCYGASDKKRVHYSLVWLGWNERNNATQWRHRTGTLRHDINFWVLLSLLIELQHFEAKREYI